MITISRNLQWDAGHRVLNHEGKCRHLHGHRYTAVVTVAAPALDPLGRVVDFGVLKSLVGRWIDENWDHNLMLNSEDPLAPLELKKLCVGGGCRPFYPDLIYQGKLPYLMKYGNPTAENIARELHDVAAGLLAPLSITVKKIEVQETPNCSATYVVDSPASY
jgi:6-pyruvoyltetrahydropterin/6-carboxytetrahydropterin synthase